MLVGTKEYQRVCQCHHKVPEGTSHKEEGGEAQERIKEGGRRGGRKKGDTRKTKEAGTRKVAQYQRVLRSTREYSKATREHKEEGDSKKVEGRHKEGGRRAGGGEGGRKETQGKTGIEAEGRRHKEGRHKEGMHQEGRWEAQGSRHKEAKSFRRK